MKPKEFTPEQILKLWDEYKADVDSNPDYIQKATNQGIQKEAVKKPYLRQGFESFVYRKTGFHVHQYIDNYQDAYAEYLGVVTCMRKEWEADQITGTMTGRYKAPNLTARLNGIKEQTDNTHEHTGKAIQINIKDFSQK